MAVKRGEMKRQGRKEGYRRLRKEGRKGGDKTDLFSRISFPGAGGG
jgi:hypothetical protein